MGFLRARKVVLQVLEVRFGEEAAQELVEPVEKLTNLEQLEALLKLAIKSRISQFRKTLAEL